MINLKKVSAVILAAGESKRMMQPKAFLPFHENIRFIDKIISEFKNFGCEDIIVVTNISLLNQFEIKDKIKFVINNCLEFGRFYSIKIGLKKLTSKDFCYIHNVDNPYLSFSILTTLCENSNFESSVIPTYQGRGGHPVLLGKHIIHSLISEERNDLNFKEYLLNFNITKVEVKDKSILLNFNTPDEYNNYFNN